MGGGLLAGVLVKQAVAEDKRKASIPPSHFFPSSPLSSTSASPHLLFLARILLLTLQPTHTSACNASRLAHIHTHVLENALTSNRVLADKQRLCLPSGSSLKLSANPSEKCASSFTAYRYSEYFTSCSFCAHVFSLQCVNDCRHVEIVFVSFLTKHTKITH